MHDGLCALPVQDQEIRGIIMTIKELAKKLDHSVLQPQLTDSDIIAGCETALRWQTATVCARPCDMPLVSSRLMGSGVLPCTVIGFPHGDARPQVKLYEAKQALDDGCGELDMVQNVGKLLSAESSYVRDEIAAICELAHKRSAIVKVILENCLLTNEQKRLACELSVQAGADCVKTSTGYGASGATTDDVRLMKSCVPESVFIKAAGGIRTLDMVLAMLSAGASRVGVSATQAIMLEAQKREESL